MNGDKISDEKTDYLKPQFSNDELTLGEIFEKVFSFWRYLRKRWWYSLLAFLIGSLLGFAYYFIQPPVYTADCTFILEEKSSAGGGLAGLASQFGFDLGAVGGSSLFAGDNLLEIIPSRNIMEKVLLSKVDTTSNLTLADLYLDFTKLKNSWANKPRLTDINFKNVNDPLKMSLLQDSVLDVIYKQVLKVNLSVDWARKKASLIRVSVTSKNERFSKYVTERVVNESKKLYIDLKTNTAQQNVNRLQIKADSLLFLLNSKSYQTAQLQVLNPNPAIKQALVPTEISGRDKAIIGTIYTEVIKNLETSKLLLNQQTPVIQVIDEPRFPIPNTITRKLICIVVGGFLFLIGMFIKLLYSYLKN